MAQLVAAVFCPAAAPIGFYIGTEIFGGPVGLWGALAVVWLLLACPTITVIAVLRYFRRAVVQEGKVDKRRTASAALVSVCLLIGTLYLLLGHRLLSAFTVAAFSGFPVLWSLLPTGSEGQPWSQQAGDRAQVRRRSTQRRLLLDLLIGSVIVPATMVLVWVASGWFGAQSEFVSLILRLTMVLAYPIVIVAGLWLRLQREFAQAEAGRGRLFIPALIGASVAWVGGFLAVGGAGMAPTALIGAAVLLEVPLLVPPIIGRSSME